MVVKNKPFYWLALLMGIIFVTGCNKIDVGAVENKSAILYNCSEKTIEPYICFDSLITDSRCPKGGECVWQGTALIKISFHEKGNIHRFIMSLKGFPDLGYPGDTTVAGHKIIFTDLKPYPEVNMPAPQSSEIKAFFSISH